MRRRGQGTRRNNPNNTSRPSRPGRGWHNERHRHSLAAHGIRTTYDELQDRRFTPSYRSLAAIMREKRLNRMRSDLDNDYSRSMTSRDSFINERITDQRKLMEMYRRNNQVPGGMPTTLRSRGVWSSIKSGAKRVGRGAQRLGGSIKRGAKKVGRGAKSLGTKITGPEGSRRRRVGGAIKSGAKSVGGAIKRGTTALRAKFAPRTYTVDTRNFRRTNDLRGDNVTMRMSIDELEAEHQRLDQSNRALTTQWTVRSKWNDRRRDGLEARRRNYAREREYQDLQKEMFG